MIELECDKMSVVLVFPRMNEVGSWSPPLGVGYMAAVLEQSGHSVSVADLTFEDSWDMLKDDLDMQKPDIVGISIQTTIAEEGFKAAEIIKEWNNNCTVIMGGPHATVMPEQVIKNKNVDIVVYGEGEYTFLELCNSIRGNKDIASVKGIFYKKDKKIIKNLLREPIQNLDELPFPARHLLPQRYFDLIETTMLASRGCPFNCAFCQPTLRLIFGTTVRTRSPKNVIDEMEFLKKRYGTKIIRFHDDTFTFNKKWVLEFCKLLKERNLGLLWNCKTRANVVDKTVFKMMKEAGCYKVDIGIEAGSERIRNDILNKGIKDEEIIRAFNILRELKIGALSFFMIGSPTETKGDIEKSMELIKKLEPDDILVSITTPFPGTRLYDFALEKDLIQAKSWKDYDFSKYVTLKSELCEEDIFNLKRKMERTYFKEKLKKPWRFMDSIFKLSGMYIDPLIALRKLTSLNLYRILWSKYFGRLGK